MSGHARRLRRLRGVVVRLAQSRVAALTAGSLLALPGAALTLGAFPGLPSFAAGIGLVLVATGAAFILIALMGHRPDWIE